MALEIEHKFLVKSDEWKSSVVSETPIEQGYLTTGSGLTVRVRLKGARAFLTIKGPSDGSQRSEFEYPIPTEDAKAMLALEGASGRIAKTRFQVRSGSHTWDLDVFAGDNAGLVMAEVELGAQDEAFDRPSWAGQEVTEDPRYFNSYLAERPYRTW
jgi:adenylate cyclase